MLQLLLLLTLYIIGANAYPKDVIVFTKAYDFTTLKPELATPADSARTYIETVPYPETLVYRVTEAFVSIREFEFIRRFSRIVSMISHNDNEATINVTALKWCGITRITL